MSTSALGKVVRTAHASPDQLLATDIVAKWLKLRGRGEERLESTMMDKP